MLNALSLLGLLVALAGAAGAYARLTSPTLGLYLAAGGVAAMGALFFPALLAWLKWRSRAGVGPALLLGFLSLAGAGAAGYFWYRHPLRDLTTDTGQPPRFARPVYLFQPLRGSELLDKSAELDRSYPRELAAAQNARYPGLESLPVKAPPAELAAVIETAVRQSFPDWKIVYSDRERPHLEAEIEDPWLRTVDDVVIEARESGKNPQAATVDYRIRNRFPYGDLGRTARRMEDIRNALAPALRQAERKRAEKQPVTKAVPAAGILPGGVSDKSATAAPAGPVPHQSAPATEEHPHELPAKH